MLIDIALLAATLVQATTPATPPRAAVPSTSSQDIPGGTALPPAAADTVRLRWDRKGRPVIGVAVNDRGPFDMVVDTGAQISVISPTLADELSLPKLSSTVAVSGATGVVETPLYGVARLSGGLFELHDAALPALVNATVTDARGIIGMDVVGGRKLTFDRDGGTLAIAPSGPPTAGFVAIGGRIRDDGLLVVPIRIDDREVEALVDSGAEGIIAGPGLIDLLGWRSDDPRLKAYGTMRGAGGAGQSVRSATTKTIRIGPVSFSDVPVVITPALADDGGRVQIILGSSLLGLLSAYAVDLGRAALDIRIPR